MAEQNDVQDLLRRGIEAAREGDKATARQLFEQVVELDEDNEKAWSWLATVVETDEEKRICLSNVLHINPGNDRARKALEKLEAQDKELEADMEIIPGVSRRQLALAVGIGGTAIVLIVAIFLIITISNNNRRAAEMQGTQMAQAAIDAMTSDANATQQARIDATATAVALVSPTPEQFVPRSTLPPTFTPTPTEGVVENITVALPFPEGLTGTISGWAGRDVLNVGFLPVGVFDATTGQFTAVGDGLGSDVRLHPNGQRILYTKYDELFASRFIEAINTNGTQPEVLAERWRGFAAVLRPEMPDYSRDASFITLIATDQDTQAQQVYVLSLADLPPDANSTTVPSPLRRITNDTANYTYPAVSPDMTRVVAVKNDVSGANPGADLVIIDIVSGAQTGLTNDLDSFVETMPRWSPDGTRIAYVAAAINDPGNNDIVIRNADGSGIPILPVRDPADDIYPVWSEDGRYLAFSSNRSGQYDIYVFDTVASTLYQLTNTPEQEYPGGWWQP